MIMMGSTEENYRKEIPLGVSKQLEIRANPGESSNFHHAKLFNKVIIDQFFYIMILYQIYVSKEGCRKGPKYFLL